MISTQKTSAEVFDLKEREFHLMFFDLYAETLQDLRARIYGVADGLGRESLRAPLFSITREIAANALKALYKRVFHKYMLSEIGLEDADYENRIRMFREEMHEHHGENFASLCRRENLFITLSGRIEGEVFRFEAVNKGAPSDLERERIAAAISRAENLTGLHDMEEDESDPLREDTGLGIPLIVLSLRGMDLDPGTFQVFSDGERTISRVDFPLHIFRADESEIQPDPPFSEIVSSLCRDLDYGVMRFSSRGDILAVSRGLLKQLNISPDHGALIREILPDAFFQDLFSGSAGVLVRRRFENYRIYISPYAEPGSEAAPEILFNVSGRIDGEGRVDTLWQEVSARGHGRLREGSMTDSMMIHRLIEPYIPRQVMARARESVRLGRMELPEEVREVTIFFADLVGFTQKVEKMAHHRVMELLNLALGVCVRSIEAHDGAIDKFMGDAVMAIFEDPLKAVVAALEIQKHFQQLNELRAITGEEPLHVRIGINTGPVIMGNIGTPARMDYTALGDVVNTASRIEKKGSMGRVLVGHTTYERIKHATEAGGSIQVKLKGKQEELRLYFIKSARFTRDGRTRTIQEARDESSPLEFAAAAYGSPTS